METIKLKKMKLIPPKNLIYVEEVKVEESNSVVMVANAKTDKESSFGKVVFSNDEDYIGNIVVIDPWKKTPIIISGKMLFALYSETGFTFVEGEKDE